MRELLEQLLQEVRDARAIVAEIRKEAEAAEIV